MWNASRIKKKTDIEEMFRPVPVSDFCHVNYVPIDVENINTDNTLAMLLAACPDSALAKHFMPPKRRTDEQHTLEESSKRLCNVVLPETITLEETFKQKLPYTLLDPEMPPDQKGLEMEWEMSEEDQMLRAIAMSLGENVLVSIKQIENKPNKTEEQKEIEFEQQQEEPLSTHIIDEFTMVAFV